MPDRYQAHQVVVTFFVFTEESNGKRYLDFPEVLSRRLWGAMQVSQPIIRRFRRLEPGYKIQWPRTYSVVGNSHRRHFYIDWSN